MEHDRWSEMGERNLGEHNIAWVDRMSTFDRPGHGSMTLMKAIINDHWADAPKMSEWTREHVDYVMSKIYYCWVRWLDETHPVEDQEVAQ